MDTPATTQSSSGLRYVFITLDKAYACPNEFVECWLIVKS